MTPLDLDIRDVSKAFGQTVALANASLQARRGELISILGPSGCGKSTLLNLLAGHLEPDSGSIAIAGRTVAGDGAFVAPEQRRVGMVFQDYALFPHLTVAENVAFAVPLRGLRARRERARRVAHLLEVFDITHLAERYPEQLSGGQQQRVAIVRALAQSPDVLLLDEPFSNLDATTREHVRTEIVSRLRDTGLTCVFVTHDQEEALSISDRVAVMQAGTIMQIDDPETLYRRPFCVEVAEFIGKTNLISGVATGSRVETEVGSFDVSAAARGEVQVLVRPELLDVRPDAEGEATVVAREFRGHDVLYTLRLPSGETVLAHRPSIDMARIGERVSIKPQPGYATLFSSPLPDAEAHSGGSDSADLPSRITKA
jgi:iron(III) transport system ATP-binding protein